MDLTMLSQRYPWMQRKSFRGTPLLVEPLCCLRTLENCTETARRQRIRDGWKRRKGASHLLVRGRTTFPLVKQESCCLLE